MSTENPTGPAAEHPTPGTDEMAAQEVAAQVVAAQLRGLRADVDLLDELVRNLAGPGPDLAPGPEQEPVELRYPTLEQWVTCYFTAMFPRPLGPAVRWCPLWWDHAEALSRLEALWRSWEGSRLDEVRGAAVWYRDFLDPQLAVLLSAGGPFAQCTPDRHSTVKALPTAQAPDGLWDTRHPAAGEGR